MKVIDQLSFRIGKQMTPTLLANTPVHMANTAFTTNMPLIANDALATTRWDSMNYSYPTTAPAPVIMAGLVSRCSVTGISTILSFSGLELSWTLFDRWLDTTYEGFSYGDYGYDWDKSKGNNLALTYAGKSARATDRARLLERRERVL